MQSTSTKRLVIVQLTVPCHSAYEMNKAKYTDLHTLYKERGYRTDPSTGGLSGFSNTISMDHIELPTKT